MSFIADLLRNIEEKRKARLKKHAEQRLEAERTELEHARSRITQRTIERLGTDLTQIDAVVAELRRLMLSIRDRAHFVREVEPQCIVLVDRLIDCLTETNVVEKPVKSPSHGFNMRQGKGLIMEKNTATDVYVEMIWLAGDSTTGPWKGKADVSFSPDRMTVSFRHSYMGGRQEGSVELYKNRKGELRGDVYRNSDDGS